MLWQFDISTKADIDQLDNYEPDFVEKLKEGLDFASVKIAKELNQLRKLVSKKLAEKTMLAENPWPVILVNRIAHWTDCLQSSEECLVDMFSIDDSCVRPLDKFHEEIADLCCQTLMKSKKRVADLFQKSHAKCLKIRSEVFELDSWDPDKESKIQDIFLRESFESGVFSRYLRLLHPLFINLFYELVAELARIQQTTHVADDKKLCDSVSKSSLSPTNSRKRAEPESPICAPPDSKRSKKALQQTSHQPKKQSGKIHQHAIESSNVRGSSSRTLGNGKRSAAPSRKK